MKKSLYACSWADKGWVFIQNHFCCFQEIPTLIEGVADGLKIERF